MFKTFYMAVLLVFAAVTGAFAASNAELDLEIINPPLRGSSFNGRLFGSDPEYLTPKGITDQPAIVAVPSVLSPTMPDTPFVTPVTPQ